MRASMPARSARSSDRRAVTAVSRSAFGGGTFVAVVDDLRDGFAVFALDAGRFKVLGGAEGVEGGGAHGLSRAADGLPGRAVLETA